MQDTNDVPEHDTTEVSKHETTSGRRVGVVVVCWNNEALLRECFESVRAQSLDASHIRTVMVDNGSEDGSVALVRTEFPEVEILEIGWNSGFAHANNAGIRLLFEDQLVDSVVLLNSDARLDPPWIEKVASFARTRPRGATFQGLTRAYFDPTRVDSHHIYINRNLHAEQFGSGAFDDRAFPTERVFGVNAAAALFTRRFLEAQPFEDYLDETLGTYLEDVDLAFRALVMGWESWFVADAFATHMGSASTKKRASGFALRQTWRNQLPMLVINAPLPLLLRGLRGVINHEIGAVRHLRANGQADIVPELFRGRRDGLKLLPYAWKRRRQLTPLRCVDADTVWEFMATGRAVQ